jgi:hypothetical protein
MQLVLRAYDRKAVLKSESLPVKRLWELMESGGLWDRSKVRAGLHESADVYSRETVVARLESLVQEGHGEESLHYLRGADPPTLVTLRRAHWPVISSEEAVQLREDMVRYLTYGLWQAPEDTLAHALALLSGRDDAAVLVSGLESMSELQEILTAVADEHAFAEAYGPIVRQGLGHAGAQVDDATLAQELTRLGQLLAPVQRLLRGAADAGLAVIVYHEELKGGDALTCHIAAAMQGEGPLVAENKQSIEGAYNGVVYSNGNGDSSDER